MTNDEYVWWLEHRNTNASNDNTGMASGGGATSNCPTTGVSSYGW